MKTSKFDTLSGYQPKEYAPVDSPYGFRNRKKDVSQIYKPHTYNSKGSYLNRRSDNYHGNVNYVLTKDNYYPYKRDNNVKKRNRERPTVDKNDKTADEHEEQENKWSSTTVVGETEEIRTTTPVKATAAVMLLPRQKTELEEVRADWEDSPESPVDKARTPTPPPSLKPTQPVVAVAAVSSVAPKPVQAAPQTHSDLSRSRLPPEVLANIAAYKLVHAS